MRIDKREILQVEREILVLYHKLSNLNQGQLLFGLDLHDIRKLRTGLQHLEATDSIISQYKSFADQLIVLLDGKAIKKQGVTKWHQQVFPLLQEIYNVLKAKLNLSDETEPTPSGDILVEKEGNTAVLFIHDIGRTCTDFSKAASFLVANNITVYAPNLLYSKNINTADTHKNAQLFEQPH